MSTGFVVDTSRVLLLLRFMLALILLLLLMFLVGCCECLFGARARVLGASWRVVARQVLPQMVLKIKVVGTQWLVDVLASRSSLPSSRSACRAAQC